MAAESLRKALEALVACYDDEQERDPSIWMPNWLYAWTNARTALAQPEQNETDVTSMREKWLRVKNGHSSIPYPWRFGQMKEFPANKFIIAANGCIVAEIHWGGTFMCKAMADAPTDVLALCDHIKELENRLLRMEQQWTDVN